MSDNEEEIRIQVAAPKAQADLLAKAAEADGFTNRKGGRSAYMLERSLAAAAVSLGGAHLAIAGELAKEIKADAEAEGLTVEQWAQRALMLTRMSRVADFEPTKSTKPAIRRRVSTP